MENETDISMSGESMYFGIYYKIHTNDFLHLDNSSSWHPKFSLKKVNLLSTLGVCQTSIKYHFSPNAVLSYSKYVEPIKALWAATSTHGPLVWSNNVSSVHHAPAAPYRNWYSRYNFEHASSSSILLAIAVGRDKPLNGQTVAIVSKIGCQASNSFLPESWLPDRQITGHSRRAIDSRQPEAASSVQCPRPECLCMQMLI